MKTFIAALLAAASLSLLAGCATTTENETGNGDQAETAASDSEAECRPDSGSRLGRRC